MSIALMKFSQTLLTTTLTPIFTAPTNKVDVIKEIVFCNTDLATSVLVSWHIVPNGQSPSALSTLFTLDAYANKETKLLGLATTMNPGDTLYAMASSTNLVSMYVSGIEKVLDPAVPTVSNGDASTLAGMTPPQIIASHESKLIPHTADKIGLASVITAKPNIKTMQDIANLINTGGSPVGIRNTMENGAQKQNPLQLGAPFALKDRYSENLCYGGTPISGGDLAGYPASLAFDGNINTNWEASQSGSALSGMGYIGYLFSSPRQIRRIVFAQAQSSGSAVSSIKIQYSNDGASWSDAVTANVYSITGSDRQIIAVPATSSYLYWRILANSATGNTSWTWAVAEIEMYELANSSLTDADIILQNGSAVSFANGFGSTGSPVDFDEKILADTNLTLPASDVNTVPLAYTDDLCNGGTAISGGDFASQPASQAFDNSTLNSWWGSTQIGNSISGAAYIGYNFGKAVAIRKMSITQLYARAISSYSIQYSDNGTTWTTVATPTGISIANTVDITEYRVIPAVGAHQYWRLLANAQQTGNTAWPWGIDEIEMYEALQTYYIFADRNTDGSVLSLVSAKQKPRVAAYSDLYTDNLCNNSSGILGAAISDSDFASMPKELAFDGNTLSNPWASNSTVLGVAFIGFNFGVNRSIRKINLVQVNTQGTSSVKVQNSPDGITWTDILTVNGLIVGTNVIALPSSTARPYWRLLANATRLDTGTAQWSVAEVQMFELATDLHFFNVSTDIMQVANAGTWTPVTRVPVGEAVVNSAGQIVSFTCYDYGINWYMKFKDIRVPDATQIDQPTTLNQFNNSLGSNGYQKLPNGLILQWGIITATVAGTNTPLPIAFPNAGLCVATTPYSSTTASYKIGSTISKTNVFASSDVAGSAWFIALGN